MKAAEISLLSLVVVVASAAIPQQPLCLAASRVTGPWLRSATHISDSGSLVGMRLRISPLLPLLFSSALVPCTSNAHIITVCHVVSPSLVPCRTSDVLLLSSLVSQHQSEFVDVLWSRRLNEPYLTARVSILSNSHVLCDTPSAPLSLVGICISISVPSRCSRLSSRCEYPHLLTRGYRAFRSIADFPLTIPDAGSAGVLPA